MSRRYTAEDMRKVAKSLLSSEVNLDFDKRDIASMLKQSADMMEREKKRDYSWEYSWAWNPNPSGVKNNIGEPREWIEKMIRIAKGDGKIRCKMFRREVGEWEEVEA